MRYQPRNHSTQTMTIQAEVATEREAIAVRSTHSQHTVRQSQKHTKTHEGGEGGEGGGVGERQKREDRCVTDRRETNRKMKVGGAG